MTGGRAARLRIVISKVLSATATEGRLIRQLAINNNIAVRVRETGPRRSITVFKERRQTPSSPVTDGLPTAGQRWPVYNLFREAKASRNLVLCPCL